MRLKSIKLAGFKSFVDPTLASFPQKMTAIVGPNGCGKSNIIDAVRWVMGESSAKSLRGESMTDVIFNGSSARKPVAQASIELVFDNSDAKITGEYARYNEIAVRRMVSRDGQSNYFLNGTRCRRKDITDIFLGTGLGPRSYSIIEQGMISRLIEARPEDMRLFIEEAAGISRYKDRRRETENRMRRTRENLERLTDIREELERQLERLSRQAQAAEKYKQYKSEERQKTAELLALRWRGLHQQASQFEARLQELEVKQEAHLADQRNVEARIEAGREAHHEVQERFNVAQQQFYSLGAEVARLEQSIRHQRERHHELYDSLQQTEQSLDEARLHVDEDKEKKALLEERLEGLTPDLEMAREQELVAGEALQRAEEEMQAWQQAWDEFNHRAGDAKREAEVEQSRIRHLETSIERMSDRANRLAKEAESLDTDPLAKEMAQLEEELAACQARLEEAEMASETCQQELLVQRQQNQQLSQQQESLRDTLQQQRSRQVSLEALQKAAMGDDGSISDWLAGHGLDERPRLADQLDVEAGWEKAVEVVLGDALHGVCVEGFDKLEDWLADLSHGNLHLFSALAGQQQAGRLAARIKSGKVPALLQSVHCVDSLGEALALRASLGAGESVVTRDGIWLGADWMRLAREAEQGGLLERRQELATLDEAIAASEEQLAGVREELALGRERAAELEAEREERQQQSRRIGHELSELNAQKSAREVRFEQISMRRERLAGELKETQELRQLEEEQLREARLTLGVALDAMEQDTGERETLASRRDALRAGLDGQRQKARELRDRGHQLAMEERALRTQCEALVQALVRQESQLEGLQQREALLKEQLSSCDQPGDSLGEDLEARLGERLAAENTMMAVRRELESYEQQARQLDAERVQHERLLQEVRERLGNERLAGQEVKVRCATLEEQLQTENYHLPTLLELLPENAVEKDWQEALEQIGQRISRLGQINLAAIEEFERESERKQYLDQQNADLEDALNTLENAIRKIDRETRTRFKEYFDRINKGFQELFPKVFGGGHAYLELTGEDLLDTGVAIMARPPGKQNSTIHLLSGGEKSMVALSLIFSIFRLNPAPFCILDEVDAPLDDANVGRFCNLVLEMSPLVQFVYITHNKIAMEMADTLMGVTMHEPGVSRLVAVDVEKAAEMAGA